MNGIKKWTTDADATLYAYWVGKTYKVTIHITPGNSITRDFVYGEMVPEIMDSAPKNPGYRFVGIYSSNSTNGTQYYTTDYCDGVTQNILPCREWTNTSHTNLYVVWTKNVATWNLFYAYEDTDGHLHDWFQEPYYNVKTGQVLRLTAAEREGYTFSRWLILTRAETESGLGPDSREDTSTTITLSMEIYLNGDANYIVMCVYKQNPCVAEGTLITLADGTQKAVENLTGKERLLVWNLETGSFDTAPILFIDHDAAREFEVIELTFSDGTTVKVITEHGFWDCDLNKYVFLRNDAAKYIGHWFNKQIAEQNGNLSWTKVQLVSVDVRKEITTSWSPVTYGHLCYYVNGMLSMPGATTGLINIFDVVPETMTIDEAAFEADIAEYGLFTYEEFSARYHVPEVIFEAFGGKYLKVAIGKGILTEEMLEALISRYSVFFEQSEIA